MKTINKIFLGLVLLSLSTYGFSKSHFAYISTGKTYFNGDSDFFAFTSDMNVLSGAKGASLAAWIKPDSEPRDQEIIAVSAHDLKEDSTSRASVRLLRDGKLFAIGRTTDSQSPVNHKTTDGKVAVKFGQWNHIAVNFDYKNDLIEFYINGELVKSVAGNSSGKTDFKNEMTPKTPSRFIAIGSEDPGNGMFFKGAIAKVIIAPKLLSKNKLKVLVKDKPTF